MIAQQVDRSTFDGSPIIGEGALILCRDENLCAIKKMDWRSLLRALTAILGWVASSRPQTLPTVPGNAREAIAKLRLTLPFKRLQAHISFER